MESSRAVWMGGEVSISRAVSSPLLLFSSLPNTVEGREGKGRKGAGPGGQDTSLYLGRVVASAESEIEKEGFPRFAQSSKIRLSGWRRSPRFSKIGKDCFGNFFRVSGGRSKKLELVDNVMENGKWSWGRSAHGFCDLALSELPNSCILPPQEFYLYIQ